MTQKKGKNTKEENNALLSGIYSPNRRYLIQKQPEEMTIGERLRRERYLRKMTLEQMSSYLDISPSYLGAIERGKRPVSRKMMELFHERLNISYDFMLEGYNITKASISQYVRETVNYSTRHKLDVLINVSSEEEIEACYQMFHTFLGYTRDKKDPKKS